MHAGTALSIISTAPVARSARLALKVMVITQLSPPPPISLQVLVSEQHATQYAEHCRVNADSQC